MGWSDTSSGSSITCPRDVGQCVEPSVTVTLTLDNPHKTDGVWYYDATVTSSIGYDITGTLNDGASLWITSTSCQTAIYSENTKLASDVTCMPGGSVTAEIPAGDDARGSAHITVYYAYKKSPGGTTFGGNVTASANTDTATVIGIPDHTFTAPEFNREFTIDVADATNLEKIQYVITGDFSGSDYTLTSSSITADIPGSTAGTCNIAVTIRNTWDDEVTTNYSVTLYEPTAVSNLSMEYNPETGKIDVVIPAEMFTWGTGGSCSRVRVEGGIESSFSGTYTSATSFSITPDSEYWYLYGDNYIDTGSSIYIVTLIKLEGVDYENPAVTIEEQTGANYNKLKVTMTDNEALASYTYGHRILETGSKIEDGSGTISGTSQVIEIDKFGDDYWTYVDVVDTWGNTASTTYGPYQKDTSSPTASEFTYGYNATDGYYAQFTIEDTEAGVDVSSITSEEGYTLDVSGSDGTDPVTIKIFFNDLDYNLYRSDKITYSDLLGNSTYKYPSMSLDDEPNASADKLGIQLSGGSPTSDIDYTISGDVSEYSFTIGATTFSGTQAESLDNQILNANINNGTSTTVSLTDKYGKTSSKSITFNSPAITNVPTFSISRKGSGSDYNTFVVEYTGGFSVQEGYAHQATINFTTSKGVSFDYNDSTGTTKEVTLDSSDDPTGSRPVNNVYQNIYHTDSTQIDTVTFDVTKPTISSTSCTLDSPLQDANNKYNYSGSASFSDDESGIATSGVEVESTPIGISASATFTSFSITADPNTTGTVTFSVSDNVGNKETFDISIDTTVPSLPSSYSMTLLDIVTTISADETKKNTWALQANTSYSIVEDSSPYNSVWVPYNGTNQDSCTKFQNTDTSNIALRTKNDSNGIVSTGTFSVDIRSKAPDLEINGATAAMKYNDLQMWLRSANTGATVTADVQYNSSSIGSAGFSSIDEYKYVTITSTDVGGSESVTLTVIATDSYGNQHTYSNLSKSLDFTSPTITITENAGYYTVDIQDNASSIEYYKYNWTDGAGNELLAGNENTYTTVKTSVSFNVDKPTSNDIQGYAEVTLKVISHDFVDNPASASETCNIAGPPTITYPSRKHFKVTSSIIIESITVRLYEYSSGSYSENSEDIISYSETNNEYTSTTNGIVAITSFDTTSGSTVEFNIETSNSNCAFTKCYVGAVDSASQSETHTETEIVNESIAEDMTHTVTQISQEDGVKRIKLLLEFLTNGTIGVANPEDSKAYFGFKVQAYGATPVYVMDTSSFYTFDSTVNQIWSDDNANFIYSDAFQPLSSISTSGTNLPANTEIVREIELGDTSRIRQYTIGIIPGLVVRSAGGTHTFYPVQDEYSYLDTRVVGGLIKATSSDVGYETGKIVGNLITGTTGNIIKL